MRTTLRDFEERLRLLRASSLGLAESLDQIAGGTSDVTPALLRAAAQKLEQHQHDFENCSESLLALPEFQPADLPAGKPLNLDLLGEVFQNIKMRAEQRAVAAAKLCKAVDVLDNILRLRSTDEAAASSLTACLQSARSLRHSLDVVQKERPNAILADIESLAEGAHSLCAVLRLVVEAGELADRDWCELHAQVERAFGRGLSTAIARSKIVMGEAPQRSHNSEPCHAPETDTPTTIGSADTTIPRTASGVRPAAPLVGPAGGVRGDAGCETRRAAAPQLNAFSAKSRPSESSMPDPSPPTTSVPVIPSNEKAKSSVTSHSDVRSIESVAASTPRGQSPTQDFRERIAALARQASKETGEQREALVGQIAWMLLIDGRYGLAYHLARTLEQRAELRHATPPSTMIRAIALAQEVYFPSGDVARQLGEVYRLHSEVESPLSEEMRSAMYFLRLAGALRPALVAPSAGASKMLRGPRTEEQLPATHNYSVRLSMYGDQTQALDLNLFRKRQSEAEWRAESAKLREDIEVWRASTASQVVTYRPTKQFFLQSHWSLRKRRGISGTNLALQSWRKWQLVVALSEELLAPVFEDRAEDAGRVRNEIERLSDVTLLGRRLEGLTERDGRMGARPEARAPLTELMRGFLGTALGFARRWTSLCRSRPGAKESMIPRNALDLKDDVLRRQEAVLKELLAYRESIRSLPVIAAITCCCRAVMQVGDLFNPRGSLIPAERDSRQVLHEELLKIPTLSMDEHWHPEATAQVLEQEILDYLARNETSWKTAFELRCQQRDHRATGRILGLSVWSSAEEHERLAAIREHLLRQCDQVLDRDISETRLRVQSALRAGFLAPHDIAEFELKMAEVDEDSGLRLEFSKCHRRLQRIRDDVERIVNLETESLRRKHAALLVDPNSPEHRLIDESIRRGDYGAVRTHLDLLASSSPLPQKEWAV